MNTFMITLLLLFVRQTVSVPRTSGDPVLIDGIFSPDEWEGANRVVVDDSVSLYVMQRGGHFFLGIRAPFSMLTYTDVYIQTEAGAVYNLHASSQLGERQLQDTLWTDASPPTHWGNARGWYANENRFDRLMGDSILRANPQTDRSLMRLVTTYRYDGYEFQIRRSKFGGSRWRLRVEVKPTAGNGRTRAFPSSSQRMMPSTWATLDF